jgi:hypothetical protein
MVSLVYLKAINGPPTNGHSTVKAGVPPNVPSLSLEAILNNPTHNNTSPDGIKYYLPFQNLLYLSTVRVVDYYPPRLEDFAVLQEHASIGYNKRRDPEECRTTMRWEWQFCLLLESVPPPTAGQPKERLKLFVSNDAAIYLLKIDPVK